ncbi:MAG: hypothetical protein KJ957_07105 [Candidatus Omnitrophica bacterium]|nr:hypothetical protein [Candidatus Omnitrophota bacterium]
MFKNLGKKERLELTITGIGIIFLIFLVIGNVQKIHKKKFLIIKANTEVVSSLSAPISFDIPEIEESDIKEGWGRDPFFLGPSMGATLEGLILNGIVWDKDTPYAIINNNVVEVGEILGGVTIIEINQNSVVLEQEEETYTLKLNPTDQN